MPRNPDSSRSHGFFNRLKKFLGRARHRLRSRGSLVVEPYRGFGSPEEVYLSGRIYRQLGWQPSWLKGPLGDLITFLMRWMRWGMKGVRIRGNIGEGSATVHSDKDGYFYLRLKPGTFMGDGVWQRLHLEVTTRRNKTIKTSEAVYIVPPESEYVVISDLDDTVMYTGVANKLKMFWRLFMEPADARVAFPGAVELYRGLYGGSTGNARNPMLYVSRAPWSIYDVLTDFFRLHRIPEGPILFLREWGMSVKQPWPNKSLHHKFEAIKQIMEVFEDRSFVLVGDSGQRDPEIYSRILQVFPGRVKAVYIRDVSDEARRDVIAELSEKLSAEDSPLVLASDSHAMAEHAASAGLVCTETVERVFEAQSSSH